MGIVVPGIGYAGLGQQSQANQLVFQKAMGRIGGMRSARKRNGGGSKKKRARRAVAAVRRARSGVRRARRAAGRFTKGSAAAKRYMAKLRRMRKK